MMPRSKFVTLRASSNGARSPCWSSNARRASAIASLSLVASCCFACNQIPPPGTEPASEVVLITELMADNEGAWIDEVGEADDWLELTNAKRRNVDLAGFELEDGSGQRARLPDVELERGESLLLWADDTPGQGASHLPFKLSSTGEHLRLLARDGSLVDEVQFEPLGINEAYGRFGDERSFEVCRYASPGRENPGACNPPEPPSLLDETFEPFELPTPYPTTKSQLVLSELALNPARFVELYNSGEDDLELDAYSLWVASQKPGEAWPTQGDGIEITLAEGSAIEAGDRVAIDVEDAHVATLADDPLFEGVVTLFEKDSGRVVDRVDFMRWPEGSSLSRRPDANGTFTFCSNTTQGIENDCDVLPSRDTGDRVRYLRTPGDFGRLAKGDPSVGVESVKFVFDMEAGGVVHLLGSERWALHYTFVREEIYHEPPLDRCDAAQNAAFYQGWVNFSVEEYFQVEGRRFLLGTLSLHAGAELEAVEYTFGDVISAQQMRTGFFGMLPHTEDPSEWVLRAQDAVQVERVREIEGTLPLVGPNAPFVDVTYQPLTTGIAFGTLRFIPAAELETATFGRDTIVVTDDVPNDIPFVAGLVTEAFQTPLAHVNVLSQNRNTPNAALRDARSDPRLLEHFDQLVRLEVMTSGMSVRSASAREVREFWDERDVAGPVLAPRLDTSLRGVQPLEEHDLTSLPMIGAKASQLAEMKRIDTAPSGCTMTIPIETPVDAFAIPLTHYVEHFEASGARDELARLRDDPDFEADPKLRGEGLSKLREMIREHPVDSDLLEEVTQAVEARFGNARVRFRSSSNTEDLPSFNGAGLYTSISAELDDDARRVDDAMRTVWASLWNGRAYDERRYANIDDSQIAMGILVHPAFLSEDANGVAVSRNVLDPNRGDIYYVNVQAGEASVTNPAPGVSTDQLIYRWPPRTPTVDYSSESSLLGALSTRAEHVMTEEEVSGLACALRAVHDWFRPRLDPDGENRWFAMESEFKLLKPDRRLLLKQARPHSFGSAAFSPDCRDF